MFQFHIGVNKAISVLLRTNCMADFFQCFKNHFIFVFNKVEGSKMIEMVLLKQTNKKNITSKWH